MRRWSFISGLTVVLLLLLILSGVSIWTARDLSGDITHIIANDFETIRALRAIRGAVASIDAQYRSSTSPDAISRTRGVFDLERAEVDERIALIRMNVGPSARVMPLDRLEALVKDYFASYEEYFALKPAETARFSALTHTLAQDSADITAVSDDIANMVETGVLQRRDAGAHRGRDLVWIATGIAIFSLLVYVVTSIRLTRAVFNPLRQLRDSIVKLSHRQFDVIVPISGADELSQIASKFNQMAAELRAYVEESDQRVVEANRLSRAIMEVLPYPIYLVDEDYRVRMKNPRAAALNAALKISGQLPAAVHKCIDNAAAAGTALVGDDLRQAVEIPTPEVSGAVPTYLPQVFRMPANAGLAAGWAVMLVDVTKLRQFDQAKTKAISTLGHEVKTPVTSIRMTLHLMLEEKIGPLTADQRELLMAGRDDCERLLAVLQALLELARFEGGRVEMAPRPTSPADLLMQAEGMHSGYFRSGAPLVTETPPVNMPLVQADAIHVVRVLGNYLSNAAKYRTPNTPVTMRATERADGYVRLSVTNQTPRPLTEAECSRIFEPFYRRAGESSEGTGLGLTICREIASAHGGRTGVWSEGEMVEFFLDLRCAGSAIPAAETVPHAGIAEVR